MYVLAFDIGSTNIKVIILSIEKDGSDEKINLIAKDRITSTNFKEYFYSSIDKYKIDIKNIEKIIVTGTGASFLDDKIDDIDIIKIDEHTAISYGGILLSKLKEAVIVSIGTGTTIVYSNLSKHRRLGGTGLGGGTFVGLSNAIINANLDNKKVTSFNELIDMLKKGNRSKVDLCIGDISRDNILNMTSDITAANFAAMYKEHSIEDMVAGVANLVLENISLLVRVLNTGLPVVYIGTMVSDSHIRECLLEIADYTGNKIYFVDEPEFAIVIGAWEYYLLKIRKNLC